MNSDGTVNDAEKTSLLNFENARFLAEHAKYLLISSDNKKHIDDHSQEHIDAVM